MSQADEFLDRVPEPPLWPEPDDSCTDCAGTGLLADPVEPCIYCDGTGHREPRRLDREQLRALEAALATIDLDRAASQPPVSLPGRAAPSATGSGESRLPASGRGSATVGGLALNKVARG